MRASSLCKGLLRFSLGGFFLVTGAMHFIATDFMLRMMPPGLPAPEFLIFISGVAELVLAGCVFFSRTRRIARWGLLALLLAVFPANVYMATHPELFPELPEDMIRWRLPFQAFFMLWVWVGTLPNHTEIGSK